MMKDKKETVIHDAQIHKMSSSAKRSKSSTPNSIKPERPNYTPKSKIKESS